MEKKSIAVAKQGRIPMYKQPDEAITSRQFGSFVTAWLLDMQNLINRQKACIMKKTVYILLLAAAAMQISCRTSKEQTIPSPTVTQNAQDAQNSQAVQKSGCPITKDTKGIHFVSYTNSGIAQQTEYYITADSLSWNFEDKRNGYRLRDVVKYRLEDFQTLVDSLSEVPFKTMPNNEPPTVGGGGSYYYFSNEKGTYLQFGDGRYVATGNSYLVEKFVGNFITQHKTKAQKILSQLMEKAKAEGRPFVMSEVPQELKKYELKW